MRATQKAVAELAGVSRTTVSYVLSDGRFSELISEEVRERVRRVAAELDYRPNRQARSLVTGRSQTMGLIVQDVVGPAIWMWNRAAAGVEEELFAKDHNVLLSRLRDSDSVIEQAKDLYQEGSVDGVIAILWGKRQDELRRARSLDMPFILLTIAGTRGTSHVIHDATVGLREAVRHTRGLGHSRATWISPSLTARDGSHRRLRAVRAEAGRQGMSVRPITLSVPARYLGPCFREYLPAMLDELRREMPSPPDATVHFCWNDQLAHAVCAVLRERGSRIPDDVSVVGFDDIDPSVHVPPLTTVSAAYREMGAAAARLALTHGETEQANTRPLVVPTYLVVRDSTGKPA